MTQILKPKLSRRDKQVARLIHAGFSGSEIQDLMGITGPSLGAYVFKLSRKLWVHSKEEIARMVELNFNWFLFARKLGHKPPPDWAGMVRINHTEPKSPILPDEPVYDQKYLTPPTEPE